jgi:hypothetical protein
MIWCLIKTGYFLAGGDISVDCETHVVTLLILKPVGSVSPRCSSKQTSSSKWILSGWSCQQSILRHALIWRTHPHSGFSHPFFFFFPPSITYLFSQPSRILPHDPPATQSVVLYHYSPACWSRWRCNREDNGEHVASREVSPILRLRCSPNKKLHSEMA